MAGSLLTFWEEFSIKKNPLYTISVPLLFCLIGHKIGVALVQQHLTI